jgi:hypothetical protein
MGAVEQAIEHGGDGGGDGGGVAQQPSQIVDGPKAEAGLSDSRGDVHSWLLLRAIWTQ